MIPDKNTYSDVWDQLDAKHAERVRVTDAALVGDEEIVRRWPEIGNGYLSRCMTALSLFTDASNNKPQSWVLNPVCGREVFPGVYRVVTVDVDVQKSGLKGIIQTLRKGWATSLVWGEARLEESERGPANDVSLSGTVPASDNPTRMLKVRFPNCDPGKVEAIAAAAGGTDTYLSPTIRGETYSGTWNTVWSAAKIEDDGSGTVTLFLAMAQYNLKSYDNFGTEREQDIFYVYDCPKNEAQTTLDAWKAAYPKGSSATANYSRSNGLVDLVLRRRTDKLIEADFGITGLDCRYTETQTAIFGTDDDEKYPIPTITDGKGISYSRTVRSNGDGTFDVILTKKQVKYRSATGLVVERTAESATTQQQQLGLTDETPASMGEEVGKIKTQRVEIRDDCSKDVVTNVQTAALMQGAGSVAGNMETVADTKKRNADTENAPVCAAGEIVEFERDQSKYPGKHDISARVRTGVPHTVETEIENAGEIVSDTKKICADDDPADPVVGDGEIVSYEKEPSRFKDKFDIRKVVRTGVEQEASSSVEGNLETAETERRITVDAETAPEAENGEMVEFSQTPSKYKNKVDVEETHRVGVPHTIEFTVANGTESEAVSRKICSDDELPPVAGPGEVVDFSKEPSRYKGKFDIRKAVKTGTPVTIGPFIEDFDGAARKTNRTIKLNVPVAQIPVATQKGQKVRVSPTEYRGLVNVEETTVAVESWYLDFDEPNANGKKPRFNRKVYWLANPADIQSVVDVFYAKVAAVTSEQYSVTAKVNREENGYYNVDLEANPLRAGGSASDWDTGAIAFNVPWCEKGSKYEYTKAVITMTNNTIKVGSLLSGSGSGGTLVDHGAGETTGVYYMGRGRYKVVLCYGSNTKS